MFETFSNQSCVLQKIFISVFLHLISRHSNPFDYKHLTSPWTEIIYIYWVDALTSAVLWWHSVFHLLSSDILIGAPRANTSSSSGVVERGAVFSCPWSGSSSCQQLLFDDSGTRNVRFSTCRVFQFFCCRPAYCILQQIQQQGMKR